MIYNVVLASASQQSGSVMRVHISTLLEILFPCKSSHVFTSHYMSVSRFTHAPLPPFSTRHLFSLWLKCRSAPPILLSSLEGETRSKGCRMDGDPEAGEAKSPGASGWQPRWWAQGLLVGGRPGEVALHTSPEVTLT